MLLKEGNERGCVFLDSIKSMKKRTKVILAFLMAVAIILFIAICFYWGNTEVRDNPSPTGEYSIRMYWTDIGGWGWQGKIYLVEHGNGDKKYWTGLTVPASSKWLSDYEFEIYGDAWPAETQIFSVYDFIN